MCCIKFYDVQLIISGSSDLDGRTHTIYKSPYDGTIVKINDNLDLDYNSQGQALLDDTPTTKTPTSTPDITIDPDILKLLAILAVVAIAIATWILGGKND